MRETAQFTCTKDTDCTFYDNTTGTICGYCNRSDYASSSVISVNTKWYAKQFQKQHPQGCGIVSMIACLPKNYNQYVANCINNICQKYKTLPYSQCIPSSLNVNQMISVSSSGGGPLFQEQVKNALITAGARCDAHNQLVDRGAKPFYFYPYNGCFAKVTQGNVDDAFLAKVNMMLNTYDVIVLDHPCGTVLPQ